MTKHYRFTSPSEGYLVLHPQTKKFEITTPSRPGSPYWQQFEDETEVYLLNEPYSRPGKRSYYNPGSQYTVDDRARGKLIQSGFGDGVADD